MLFRRFKFISFLTLTIIIFWGGWNTYTYFFSKSSPKISIEGIDESGWYSQDLYCTVKGCDDYKVSTISLTLDGKPLITNQKINKSKLIFYNFRFNTQIKFKWCQSLRFNTQTRLNFSCNLQISQGD